MINKPAWVLCASLLLHTIATAQTSYKKYSTPFKELTAKRITDRIKIDGIPDEPAWKTASDADKFIALRPTPFKEETSGNATHVYIMYNNEGIYVGGDLRESKKDSISSELIGRDGFGSNDFLGVVFDTYQDKLNAFEYFVTPLGEQMDAKVSPNNNGNSEDFSWNAVWQSAAKINDHGWTFEMFIPYSAIRFGSKKVQDWGFNIVRRRQKCGEQLFWQPINPTVNGFLTQEGTLKGLEDLKPPLRLQFSPYFSTYFINDANAPAGTSKTKTQINGGMDVKYGINQAFTLDMTLIPDFGQVQSDNRILNLSPFEQKFNENRAFFTEGTELFNKGNLFYSRRIGLEPTYRTNLPGLPASDSITEYPSQAKIVNATKISGRTQKGLGIGILNAITKPQHATILNKNTGEYYELENMPLTNYNILVINQSLKHNSSISLVNTNVLREGNARDANVTAGLFDFFDKKNMWNLGGNVTISNIYGDEPKATTGYAHSIYFGKVSGRFNFNFSQDFANKKFDKSDMGYFTNNNSMDNYLWVGYNWTKPHGWYNNLYLNFNSYYSRLVSPIDLYKGKALMFQNAGGNVNLNGQTKKLWYVGASFNWGSNYNDFYEPRDYGRVFHNKGNWGVNVWWNNNQAKKLSWGGSLFTGQGGVFKRTSFNYNLFGKIRFSSKFSVDHSINVNNSWNQPGWASTIRDPQGRNPLYYDTVIFSRRNVISAENILNFKYNFTNRMGLSLRIRHYWSKVDPQQFYQLNVMGDLVAPTNPFTKNVNQNYNYFSTDMLFTWEFTRGSFVNIAWKDLAETFTNQFEKNYMKNFSNTTGGPQANSFSIRVVYFLDYLSVKNKWRKK